ncbi:hypothetical protein QT971_09235 [Microcoleus sp. herbarium19]
MTSRLGAGIAVSLFWGNGINTDTRGKPGAFGFTRSQKSSAPAALIPAH